MDKLAFRVAWSAEDGEYVATVDGMPSLSWVEPDPVDALAGLVRVAMREEPIREEDLRIEAFRGAGVGGQVVYDPEPRACVRITHLPTGLVATASEGRSQLENKRLALQELSEMLQDAQPSAHVYLSTSCLHGDIVLPEGRTGHEYCRSESGQCGQKTPGVCKFCQAPCVCPCHGRCDD